MFREKEICNAIRTAYLYLFPDKKERKRALSRLMPTVSIWSELLWARVVSTAGILHLPKNYPESFYAGGCFLHPGTMALGGRAVCGCLLREYEILFGV